MTIALPQNRNKSQNGFSAAPGIAQVNTRISAVALHEPDAKYLAHDARNWLTILQVYCDLLRTTGAVASGYEKWMEELAGAVERGHGLMASLLDSVEKATAPVPASDQQHANTYPLGSMLNAPLPSLNVADAIARRLPMFEHLAGSNIHIDMDAPPDAGDAAIPESDFERILQNLVGNAIEAMPHGGRLRIALQHGTRRGIRKTGETSSRPAPKTLLLRVCDTGDGIPPERLPYIFEAGVSSKQEHGRESTPRGFGLAIVRDLTERAGGSVRVQSHPGRGSCFEIELP